MPASPILPGLVRGDDVERMGRFADCEGGDILEPLVFAFGLEVDSGRGGEF